MGRGNKRGGRGGGRGGRGGGGGRGRGGWPDTRTDKSSLPRTNAKFEQYYNELEIVPEEERDAFWTAMKTDLPNSFRFTGSKVHALAVQERLRNFYIPEITSIQYEGQYVDAPQPVEWYPDKLAWFMTTPKNVIRRFKPFASFQKFLVAETDVGNITRQEIVSMIPPLVMDIQPGMTVLDLCAAPGSKSAQMLELICAGEEDRAREVAHNLSNGLDRPQGEDFADDGRSTGLLIANDVDYKRAHMLVHQMKRLSSPNLVVTNHDATMYPSIKISSETGPNGKPMNRYLKFDRILADVPCSGDGTLRKNLEIWKNWTASNGLGLHTTQVKILVRALQMLKVGGRVVYSTCSMNPVEDEAVLASAISQCGGSDIVQLLETKDLLPGLKRYTGKKTWSIMDKAGRMHDSWESVEKQRAQSGDDGLSRLQETMFPPKDDLPLDRAMRVYPHSQNTGAFFIAILEKKTEIKYPTQKKQLESKTEETTQVQVADSNGTSVKLETDSTTGEVKHVETVQNGDINGGEPKQDAVDGTKRKREEDETLPEPSLKRVKSEEDMTETLQAAEQQPPPQPTRSAVQPQKKPRDAPFEESFKYLPSTHPELLSIQKFYNLSPSFPLDRFMVRNAEGTASKNIYYTTELARNILQHNEGKGMKFVHSGVKMFVKQDAPSPETCPWRIQTDGLRILETWVGDERKVRLQKRSTLRKLLVEMFPRFHDDDWASLGELGPQMRDMGMGCCVLIVEPTLSPSEPAGPIADSEKNGGSDQRETTEDEGFNERMIFPLWKSIHSLNLMMPKEDRKAMLLRLFNDDSPLENMTLLNKLNRERKEAERKERQEDDVKMVDVQDRERGNTSSPEPETMLKAEEGALSDVAGGIVKSDDEEDGGVELENATE